MPPANMLAPTGRMQGRCKYDCGCLRQKVYMLVDRELVNRLWMLFVYVNIEINTNTVLE